MRYWVKTTSKALELVLKHFNNGIYRWTTTQLSINCCHFDIKGRQFKSEGKTNVRSDGVKLSMREVLRKAVISTSLICRTSLAITESILLKPKW